MDKLHITQLKSLFDEIGHYNNIDDHFREVTKMVVLSNGSKREITDFILARYTSWNSITNNAFYIQ